MSPFDVFTVVGLFSVMEMLGSGSGACGIGKADMVVRRMGMINEECSQACVSQELIKGK